MSYHPNDDYFNNLAASEKRNKKLIAAKEMRDAQAGIWEYKGYLIKVKRPYSLFFITELDGTRFDFPHFLATDCADRMYAERVIDQFIRDNPK